MAVGTASNIPVASRNTGFDYAIRAVVAEAREVEASGRRVKYLNIGDPILFGFPVFDPFFQKQSEENKNRLLP